MISQFSIFDPGFYEASRNGAHDPEFGNVSASQWFQTAVALEFQSIAAQFGCACEISEVDTEIARAFWLRDIGRMDIDGDGVPNHFKQAGFLSYWLRRRMVLRNPRPVVAYDSQVGKDRQMAFLQMAPEWASLIFGYNLCLFAESRKAPSDVSSYLRAMRVDFSFAHDMCNVMRNKHISPHSLMMIYRALFHR